MSLSVNNPSFVKFDAPVLDQKEVSPSKTGERSNAQAPGTNVSHTPLRIDNSPFSPNEVMIPGVALAKLFDMLEQIFKTIREMVAGKDLTPTPLPDVGKSTESKMDVRNLPANADAGKQLQDLGKLLGKSGADKPSDKPVADGLLGKSGADKQANMPSVDGAPGKSGVDKSLDMQDLSTLLGKSGTDKQANMPGAGRLLGETDAGTQLNTPQPRVKPQAIDLPEIKHDASKQTLTVSYPPTTKLDGTVNNDARAGVNVHVNVNCHCTDTKVSADGVVVSKQVSGQLPMPDAGPQLVHQQETRTSKKQDLQPGVPPKADDKVEPDLQPKETQVGKDKNAQPGVPPKATDTIKPDHQHPHQHPHQESQTVKVKPAQPGGSPDATVETTAQLKPSVVPDRAPRPAPDSRVLPLTSPGPDEDYFAQEDGRLNSAPMFRS